MSELVVFTARENFDFLKFSSLCSTKQQEVLKADCVMVQETQKLTAQTFGVWALRLVDLRDCGLWESVINPETGFAFYNEGFGAFCKYAFGLSETATSNLTKVAQFIQNHGENVGALDERYRGYSFSQLVELSSVSPENRQYFSSDMTVKEMRTAKNYMKMGGFFEDKNNADFDLLKYSMAFEEERKSGVAKKNNPEVIPGQIELEDISDSVEVNINPTSELANAGERVLSEDEREEVIKHCLLSFEGKRKTICEKYKENPTTYEFVQCIQNAYAGSWTTSQAWVITAGDKGLVISPLCGEKCDIFLRWNAVAARIVTLINRGEYYTETDEVNQHADLASLGEDETDIYDIPMQTHSYDTDDYDEQDEAYEDMQADMQTIEDESEPVYKFNCTLGKSRVEVRALDKQDRIVFFNFEFELTEESDEYNREDNVNEAVYYMALLRGYCDARIVNITKIEEESERSLPPAEEKPVKKYDFSTRDNIRMFLNDYKNWHKREDILTPYTKHCYWFTLPNFDMVYAFETNVATQELLQGVRNYEKWASYYIFPRSLYKDSEEPSVFEIAKKSLEGYLMAHRDELNKRR